MSVAAAAEPVGHGPVTVDTPMIELLVSRLCSRYDVEPAEIRGHVADILGQFADARLHAFIPILVEKQLRERLLRSAHPLHAVPLDR